jgi:tetratricopeptide (TPR) repeat protein
MQRFLIVLTALVWAAAPARPDTVLVLPFFNQSSATNLDWISESISHTIEEALGAHGVLVLDRGDREQAYRRLSVRPNAHLTRASVIRVAETLDASTVIHGEYVYTPPPAGAEGARGSLRITCLTLDMLHMKSGPEFIESGQLEDLAGLQAHLAWQVLGYLMPKSTPPVEQFMKEQSAVRLDALENYIRGLLATAQEQKHRFFTQAARLDEHFSGPAIELGRMYWHTKEYRLAEGWFAKVEPGAAHYSEANFLLGLCRYLSGNFPGAQAAFELVARAVPLNEVFNDLGAAQSRRNLPEALENFRKALEGDPADPDYHFNVGYELWKRGNFEDAANAFRAALQRSPEDAQATVLLGRCLQKSGPRPNELRSEGLERLKLNYEEAAYWQLKAALETAAPAR